MKCENCESRGYAYCFHYPHSIPTVKLKVVQKQITVTQLEFRDD